MKKKYVLISICLLISLFIYLFYRTQKTVVNELLIWLISRTSYTSIKAAVIHTFPLNNMIIYSLPEGLWMYCITLTSKPYYISLNKRHIDCVYIPLVYCFLLKILQLVHVTNGRFDLMDIVFFVSFWLLGRYTLREDGEKQYLFTGLHKKALFCFLSYGIVYLAHVVK